MNWDVHLTFIDDSSRKFWRARVDGTRLYINFGRIGSDGQTQIKDLDSPERARRELETVAASKRKKGYDEAEAAPEGEAEERDDEESDDEESEEAQEPDDGPARAPAKASRSAPARSAAGKGKAAAAAAPAPQVADLALHGERNVDLRLVCAGNMVRTVVVERYDSSTAASEAFERLRKAMAEEGYQATPPRPDL